MKMHAVPNRITWISRAAGILLFLSIVVLACANDLVSAQRRPVKARAVSYSQDIRPILAANCFACHGQDSSARQANLRLDTREDAIALRGARRAVEPGKPEKSGLVMRVNAANAAFRMPPPSTGHTLTLDQKRLLTQWVREGAPYDVHWAFKPVSRPPIPNGGKRKTKNENSIDSFVREKLESVGLSIAKEADRHSLIRRLSLDLTGLPPTLQEVDSYMSDRSDRSYENLVDRLLASPRYGEHWARMWLDLARYADTQGYEKDLQRTIWRYRDWVIDAFNADMPYDQFTIEQLAGDLLPNATESQILATAFHRNTMTNTEGGVDPEEFRVAAVKDRVDTTGQVWMGLTIGCAKCHSHKYDPVTMEEYYRFYAVFNQTEDFNRGNESPTAPMPTVDHRDRLAGLDAKLKALREQFWKETPGQKDGQVEWERTLAAAGLWTPLRLEESSSESGAAFKPRPDGAILVSGPHAEKDAYTLTFTLPAHPINALRLEALKDPSLPKGGPGRDASDQNVVTSEFVAETGDGNERKQIPLQNARADFEQQGWKVAGAIDGKPDTGWAWSPQNGQPHVAVFDLKTPLTLPGGKLTITIRQNFARLQHGCFRISASGSDTALLKPELTPLSDLAAKPPKDRGPEEQKRLDEGFRQAVEPTAAIYKELSTLEKERAQLDGEIPRIPVMRELQRDKQRTTRIHQRGNFLDPGEVVTPAVIEVFGSLPDSAAPDRLGLARWLVSTANPLTARAAVNRVWSRLFGAGLVETEEDFGTQGTPPTNPELLDWLAAEFMNPTDDGRRMRDQSSISTRQSAAITQQEARGTHQNPSSVIRLQSKPWSLKQLLKTIVMSATYRQSAELSPAKRKVDPENRLFSRGPRFRLPAEVIRDQALAVSGLLSKKMHGPSVMPPQPEGIWRTVYSGLKWETSKGEDRYRRALYTFWRRTSPYPSMTTFDAGSGEFCVIRRVRTNTPLQALVTLNDPVFVEAAGALAKSMLRDAPSVRIANGTRKVLARPATTVEIARLDKLFRQSIAEYRRDPESARTLLKSANTAAESGQDQVELAALVAVANVLLNLDETLTKP